MSRTLMVKVTVGENRFPEDIDPRMGDDDKTIASFMEDVLWDRTRKEHGYPWTIEGVELVQ